MATLPNITHNATHEKPQFKKCTHEFVFLQTSAEDPQFSETEDLP